MAKNKNYKYNARAKEEAAARRAKDKNISIPVCLN